MGAKIRRIVVVSKMTYGDFVLILPFLSELRRRNPDAWITILCGRRGSSLCRLYPAINEVVNLGELRPGRDFFTCLGRLLALFRSDLIYALHPLFFAGVVSFLLAGRRRIGFSQASTLLFTGAAGFEERASVSPLQEWLLRRVVLHKSMPMQTSETHAAARFLQLLGKGAAEVPSLCGQLSSRYPRKLVVPPRVVLAPFSGWTPRNWPLARWVELAERLQLAIPAVEILVSVDPSSAGSVRDAFATRIGVEIFVPGDDFDWLFRVFSEAALIVSNDSFPLHAASALNVPSIGLFGPNVPKWFGGCAEVHDDLYHSIGCNPCLQLQGNEPCLRGFTTCAALDAWSAQAVAERCFAILKTSVSVAG